jgi:hypothetical protein
MHQELLSNIILKIYADYYKQNNDEYISKQMTLKVVDDTLRSLKISNSLVVAYDKLYKEFQEATDKSTKDEIYKKIEVLVEAKKIMEG